MERLQIQIANWLCAIKLFREAEADPSISFFAIPGKKDPRQVLKELLASGELLLHELGAQNPTDEFRFQLNQVQSMVLHLRERLHLVPGETGPPVSPSAP